MGLFDIFKKKDNGLVLGAHMAGKCVSIQEVPDPTFGAEILGKGIAVIPSDGHVYAPVDGTVGMVFPTKHALSITAADGAEILIHVGLDTVELNGAPFEAKVSADQAVKKGDLLLVADLEAIKAAGKDIITPVVICNSDAYSNIETFIGKDVAVGDDVMKLVK